MPLDTPQGPMAESPLPTRPSAIALSAGVGNAAPRVVAKGYGAVAEAIVQRAQESGLYVHTSPDLVKLLMHVDLDSRIPPNLYIAVAEMLSWVHQLERQQK
ncbi:MAG: EscU/YscU/HrcU family type III secretion system export apparatus switch protein [Polaromonas sp.]|uniref:EscU/YscU/HrcU family type III secretion system export apparatus switch protein n=1 Tax=Polaromonas sp. TaxID=1869339 RepID=UPI00248A3FB0|nr:EscU/YscU/HrcU family type III secretion system export apparatus switch protein [Polaromonas sp.]MDI1268719.1 EscU/YscU/HrcU family type III secretion system export apparatus switch protein [Polaromonas sp.]